MGNVALAVNHPGTAAPKGWQWLPLTSVARMESGHTPSRKKAEYWGGDIPWVGIKDAKKANGATIHETLETTNALGIAHSSARVLPAGTVCLSRTASVGYVAKMGRAMATSQDFANWVCSDRLDPDFLRLLFIAEGSAFSRFSSGSVHQTIYYPELKAFHVCIPSLEEQKRIVAVLDQAFAALDRARAHAEANLADAEELFQAFKATLMEHPEGFAEEVSLAEVASIETKLVDPREPLHLDLPHVGAGNMITGSDTLVDVLTAREEALKSGKHPFDSQTVLYSKIRPYLMKVARPNFCGLCSADVYPLTPSTKMDRNYLFHLLLSAHFTDYAISGSDRAGMPKVNRNHLFSYKFALPEIDMQRDISARIDSAMQLRQSLVDAFSTKLDDIADLRQSLLQKAFSGQLNT